MPRPNLLTLGCVVAIQFAGAALAQQNASPSAPAGAPAAPSTEPDTLAAALAALERADEAPDPDPEVYATALTLGRRAFDGGAYTIARAAFARSYANAFGDGELFIARQSHALAQYGAALLMETGDQRQAYPVLTRALRNVQPHLSDRPERHPEIYEAYQVALAWRSLAVTLMRNSRDTVPIEARGAPSVAVSGGTFCAGDVRLHVAPRFPLSEVGGAGVILVELEVQADGAISARRVLRAMPDEDRFTSAVTRVFDRWTLQRAESDAPDCVWRSRYLVPVNFIGNYYSG
jgi:hypothetical protein